MARALEEFSADDLLVELRAREERELRRDEPPLGLAEAEEEEEPELNPELEGHDTDALRAALRDMQEVIYGVDDRVDIFQITDAALLEDADCVVALFDAADVIAGGDGTSTLRTVGYGTSRNLCAGEPFSDQPTGAFCSGFLVGSDLVATAGHCVDPPNTPSLANIRFVFGFRMVDATTAPGPIPNGEIYSGAQLVGRELDQTGIDWALVRLDRPVTNHRPAPIRRRRRIRADAEVHVIGHPVGLPAKLAGGATVRDNTPRPFFVANLDTYGGNSGSAVFNSSTHRVEGILVRGERDFVRSGNCNVSLVCPTTGCRGEDVTRITRLARLIPPPTPPGWTGSLQSLAIEPDRIETGDQGEGTVTVSEPAPPEGLTVELSSSHPHRIVVPPSVAILGGETHASFVAGIGQLFGPSTIRASLGGVTLTASAAHVVMP
jgi:hypothetical protein